MDEGVTGGDAPRSAGGPWTERVRVTEPERYPAVAAGTLARTIRSTLERDGSCALALAGGSTPAPVYRRLARAEGIDWSRVAVFFGDERAVPPDHEESNYRMARETLLDPAGVPEERVHRMPADAEDLGEAARAYGRALPDRLDVLVLGIGGDGHIASLFPGSPSLRETSRRVVPVEGPEPPVRRLTITPRVVEAARRTFVLATGDAKAPAVACALDPETEIADCPAGLARGGCWILDRAAAAGRP